VKQAGKVVVPKGTKLIGHVAQAQPRSKAQSQSALGVVFDYAEMRNGQQMPLSNIGIQALAMSQSAAQASNADSSAELANSAAGAGSVSSAPRGGGLGGGGLVGGTLNTTSNTVGSVAGGAGNTVSGGASSALGATTHSAGAVGGLNAAGVLTSDSQGVFGLQGMSVDSAASSATQGSMIVSSTRNVHLDSGTQMLLRAGAHTQ